ncbi:amino acid transporter [Skermania sp. ID1734]|uniref:amino acid transporter n=1 Tax=Skermania sp. ID1734 TaxID=2597516 RepID=UPI00117C0F6A|nr:amino acid transporter [Skermania sp. ID1734]TSE00819.1 amino acid transporter [Skermania sp. ID1734]
MFADVAEEPARHQGPYRVAKKAEHKHPWWKVMCLTGVDYFSTLGYQPGIAALAAGVLSPMATLVLVALTLLGALPVYRRVARESPHGEGSIAMLARLLPRWSGKLFVLVLLGFAATDFIITMTLSAADGAAHLIENPFAPAALHDRNLIVTLVLLGLLAAVFLRGFTEAIGIAVALVGAFLVLNFVVVVVGLQHVLTHPHLVGDWGHAMTAQHGSPWMMIAISLLVFPKLALGLSGFETGVAVMPQINGAEGDSESRPTGRIHGARKLLTTSALIMSAFLIVTSFITIVLIPEKAFQSGGPANGRALAYLAHEYLGNAFGTVYDVSTIAILWFAGASAMAGLLNLVPRYLPRYGMAPEWARYVRPLVLVFSAIAFGITWYFNADVDSQGAAYATGVLVLITSAAIAVMLSAARHRQRSRAVLFGVVAAIFVYTTVANIIERPEGVQVAAFFIVSILTVSFVSRLARAFELRAIEIDFDERAAAFIDDAAGSGTIRIVTHDDAVQTAVEYRAKDRIQRLESHIPDGDPILFLEVHILDASEFSTAMHVRGCEDHGYRILRVDSAAIPNCIAAILLAIRDRTGVIPHVYFEWTEGNPVVNLLRFLFIGEGEVAPVTREVLRRAEPEVARRPHVHVDS